MSVSSRYSWTRPTSSRQIWAVRSSPSMGIMIVTGCPEASVTSAAGRVRDWCRSSTRAANPKCRAAGGSSRCGTSARHPRGAGLVRGLLQDVAGENSEPAGVDG